MRLPSITVAARYVRAAIRYGTATSFRGIRRNVSETFTRNRIVAARTRIPPAARPRYCPVQKWTTITEMPTARSGNCQRPSRSLYSGAEKMSGATRKLAPMMVVVIHPRVMRWVMASRCPW